MNQTKTNNINLNQCQKGDILISRNGTVLQYTSPTPYKNYTYLDHVVKYIKDRNGNSFNNNYGTRTNDGYVFAKKRMPQHDEDIKYIIRGGNIIAENQLIDIDFSINDLLNNNSDNSDNSDKKIHLLQQKLAKSTSNVYIRLTENFMLDESFDFYTILLVNSVKKLDFDGEEPQYEIEVTVPYFLVPNNSLLATKSWYNDKGKPDLTYFEYHKPDNSGNYKDKIYLMENEDCFTFVDDEVINTIYDDYINELNVKSEHLVEEIEKLKETVSDLKSEMEILKDKVNYIEYTRKL
jgi:hypothetical protein